jgi:sigma-54 dependent transcriptional regulator, acetoin dehydrogenase operon transcriptional activator AcoR
MSGEPLTQFPLGGKRAGREALLRVIEKNDWVMSHVAAQLGISRNTLYRKIKRHRIPLTRN